MKNANIRLGLLAFVLAWGFAAFWAVFGMWAAQVGAYVVGAEEYGEGLSITTDGRAVISRTRGGQESYRDLDGNPISADEIAVQVLLTSYWPALPEKAAKVRAPWSARVSFFSDWRSSATFWYFVKDGTADGAGWFEGYDSGRKTRVGYLGVGGFREDKPTGEDCFRASTGLGLYALGATCASRDVYHHDVRSYAPVGKNSFAAWEIHVCIPGDKVYRVDLRTHQVTVAFRDPRLVVASVMMQDPSRPQESHQRLAVRLDDAIVLVDRAGQEVVRYPIPASFRGKPCTIAQVPTKEVVLMARDPGPTPCKWLHRISWSSPEGWSREAEAELQESENAVMRMGGLILPSPMLAWFTLTMTEVKALLDRGLAPTFPEAVARSVAVYWRALLVAHAIAVALAILCHLRQRRYGATRGEQIGWALFVLVLGLPGWIGYRFGRSWPVLEKCGECGRVVPRDGEECLHCATEFAPPALLGTEVFA